MGSKTAGSDHNQTDQGEKTMSEELSRRSFVSGAVAAGALGSLASVALADEAAPAGEGLRYVPSALASAAAAP